MPAVSSSRKIILPAVDKMSVHCTYAGSSDYCSKSPAQVVTGAPQRPHQSDQKRTYLEAAQSYMDQLKTTFENEPQVYNEFLDAMKKYKEQKLNMAGVMVRVSDLFRGRPDLITAFNGFLPPGYKIEVSAKSKSNAVGSGYSLTVLGPHVDSAGKPSASGVTSSSRHADLLPSVAPAASSRGEGEASARGNINLEPHQVDLSMTNAWAWESFANKVQTCLHDQPEKYKSVLQILCRYQKQHGHVSNGTKVSDQLLTETELYSQLEKLFENHSDLLVELRQLLFKAMRAKL